jgi:prolyl oligopeptidase
MPGMTEAPPVSRIDPVTDILHGVPVTDPYRWLEEQNSPETRAWIAAQTVYARNYLDRIPGRERIRERVRELLDVETYDSFLKCGNRYFFRKRLRAREQPSIYFREGPEGEDQLLLDPRARGTGDYTSAKPVRVSPEGSLLLYEVKQGGERMGTFEIMDVASRSILPDRLSRGYLRGFAFAPDGRSFYYIHEQENAERPLYRAAHRHVIGTDPGEDQEVFSAGEGKMFRLLLVPGSDRLGYLLYRFLEKTYLDFYLAPMESAHTPVCVFRNVTYSFAPILTDTRILAATNRYAPNRSIVEVHLQEQGEPCFTEIVPAQDFSIRNWTVARDRIVVAYVDGTRTRVECYSLSGEKEYSVPIPDNETVHLHSTAPDPDELFLERESFTRGVAAYRLDLVSGKSFLWATKSVPFHSSDFTYEEHRFHSLDGVRIPLFVVGRIDLLRSGSHPVILTAYGGYGVPVTPQFSVLAATLMERGCLLALAAIRGGSEFGAAWHRAATRRHRQVAFDDFLAAAEWLIARGRTEPSRLAVFGGSNSGLLVAAAITQRPECFRAALSIVPLTDMLRYHLFDNAHVWRDEFGTAEEEADFRALVNYSPYHQIQMHMHYPAVMFVSGDADQTCNGLHARKMTARLQTATGSERPIFLDYLEARGHSPVLPLSVRVDALADRVAFLCDQLQIPF